MLHIASPPGCSGADAAVACFGKGCAERLIFAGASETQQQAIEIELQFKR